MRFYTISSQGTRPINEDSIGVTKHGNYTCFVVADGLGGHGKGEVASQLAVNAFEETFSAAEEQPICELLADAFSRANDDILQEQQRTGLPSQMKTTAVALVIHDEKIVWGHIGDSRLYAFARNKMKIRTLDHSVPQMLVLSGEIKEKAIRGHPDRNRLLRVLGLAGNPPRFELSEEHTSDQFQAFLLCSDGFWELITEKEMGKLLKRSSSPEEWLEQMRVVVESNGLGTDMDNYSAIAVML